MARPQAAAMLGMAARAAWVGANGYRLRRVPNQDFDIGIVRMEIDC
jgi:hypothetical protein